MNRNIIEHVHSTANDTYDILTVTNGEIMAVFHLIGSEAALHDVTGKEGVNVEENLRELTDHVDGTWCNKLRV